MKMLVLASLVLCAPLAMNVSGQAKSVAAANNQEASKLATDQSAANATRARVLRRTPDVASTTKSRSDFNNHSEVNRSLSTSVSPATNSGNKTLASVLFPEFDAGETLVLRERLTSEWLLKSDLDFVVDATSGVRLKTRARVALAADWSVASFDAS